MVTSEINVDGRIIQEIDTFGTVYENKFVSVKKDKVRFPNGVEGEYTVIKNGSGIGAIVIPVTVRDGEKFFGLVHQYRYPVQAFTLEFPRGGADDFSEDGASIEISEELGQDALTLKMIGTVHPDTGILLSEVGLWVAEMDNSILDTDHIEDITGLKAQWMSENEFRKRMRNREVTCGMTLAAYSLFNILTIDPAN